jgi:DNA-binding NarL/FixJ family response regulator/class 3 adenylate cyclase
MRVERRLSAILAADVAGYSRLMHNDEEATHSKLAELLTDAVNPAIAEHRGRIVKNTGDGFLAEFPSAVEAVRAAIQLQSCINELTIGDAEDRRIAFRVGVNIGDVIVEPHDIFGDGVNIAARLEGIAKPGGICISASAYDQVHGKVGVEFADLGEQILKNIASPVRTYAVVCNDESDPGSSTRETPGMKILVVDDHVLIREAMRGVLRELKGEAAVILEASDSRQAMCQIEQNPDLELVLLDLGLPDRDGLEMLSELCNRYPTISVVVLSAQQDRDTVMKALDLGALGFIPKSGQREVMLSAFNLIFSGGVYIPPEILNRREPATAPRAAPPPSKAGAADLGLTERQMEVLALMMQGKGNKAISRVLDLAEPTVKIHVSAILKALKVVNRTEAVIAATTLGLGVRHDAR